MAGYPSSNLLFILLLILAAAKSLSFTTPTAVPTKEEETHKISPNLKNTCNWHKSLQYLPNHPSLPSSCYCYPSQETSKYNSNKTKTDQFSVTFEVRCFALQEVPQGFPESTRMLNLKETQIESLKKSSFSSSQLTQLGFFSISHDKALKAINEHTFSPLHKLHTIIINIAPNLIYISGSAFYGLKYLKTIKIVATGLTFVQGFNDFGPTPGIHLTIIMSSNHHFSKIQKNAFQQLNSKRTLSIKVSDNPSLTSVEDFAFNGSHAATIDLSRNKALTDLSHYAFTGCPLLENLDVSNTPVKLLPGEGLQNLWELHAENTPNLVRIPTSKHLSGLKRAFLTYPYHCCALKKYGYGQLFFNAKNPNDNKLEVDCKTGKPKNITLIPGWNGLGGATSPLPTTTTTAEPNYHEPLIDLNAIDDDSWYELFGRFGFQKESVADEYDYGIPDSHFSEADDDDDYNAYITTTKKGIESTHVAEETSTVPSAASVLDEDLATSNLVIQTCYLDKDGNIRQIIHREPIHCIRAPGPFNPCEDLLGHRAIVIASWFVASLAVIGNVCVIITIMYVTFDRSRAQEHRLPVPKFLILNLATADFFLGIYIFSLAVVNEKTTGSYYQFGVEWQTMGGCDGIGFLSMFASQLSIYTLSVLSLERWYAIRYAINLEKRMSLKMAVLVMVIGWLLSIFVALLPLVGVNSYRATAICMPMDVAETSGFAYIVIVLILDVIGFLLVVGSYVWMYFMVRTNQNNGKAKQKSYFSFLRKQNVENSVASTPRTYPGVANKRAASDARVAKKMAVLVFTDFACMFPICFFSFFALFDMPLLTISTAKILLVCFYPLNSCCNPFLYAILTKSFRKDFMFLVKTLKYSDVFHNSRQKFPSPQSPKKSDSNQKSDQRHKTSYQGNKANENGHLQLQSNISGTKVTSIRSRTASLICNSRRSSSASKAMKPTKPIPQAKTDGMNTISERKSSKQSDSVSTEKQPATQTKVQAFLSRLGMPILNEKNSPLPAPPSAQAEGRPAEIAVKHDQPLPAITVTTPHVESPFEVIKTAEIVPDLHHKKKAIEHNGNLSLNFQENNTFT